MDLTPPSLPPPLPLHRPMEFLDRVTPMILCYNEAENIGRTVACLQWAREVIVVDSGSTDATLGILAGFPNVRVITRPFDSAAAQGNFGLDAVAGEWVLSLDSDYLVPPELVDEMARIDPATDVAGFTVGFTYMVFGRRLRSTIYPPRTVLYRVAAGRYHDEGHTQRVAVRGIVENLTARIDHDDRKPILRWFSSQNAYVRREADYLLGLPARDLSRLQKLRLMMWPAPFAMLLYTLFVKGYVLDGRAGLYYAFQRTLAELMLAVELLDRKLRP